MCPGAESVRYQFSRDPRRPRAGGNITPKQHSWCGELEAPLRFDNKTLGEIVAGLHCKPTNEQHMSKQEQIQKAARYYLDRCGFSVIPIGNDKRPLGPWVEQQKLSIISKDVDNWTCEALGIVTGTISGIVVVDCDSKDDSQWWWNNRPRTTCVVKTRRGAHFYYRLGEGELIRNGAKIEGRYDIRGEGGYVVAAPSKIGDFEYQVSKEYRNFDVQQMPYFDSRWRPEVPHSVPADKPKITNAANYIKTIRAVSGSGGDKATFRVACVLRDAGLSESEALLEILSWNDQNADPPWTPRELQYKVECAYMRGTQ